MRVKHGAGYSRVPKFWTCNPLARGFWDHVTQCGKFGSDSPNWDWHLCGGYDHYRQLYWLQLDGILSRDNGNQGGIASLMMGRGAGSAASNERRSMPAPANQSMTKGRALNRARPFPLGTAQNCPKPPNEIAGPVLTFSRQSDEGLNGFAATTEQSTRGPTRQRADLRNARVWLDERRLWHASRLRPRLVNRGALAGLGGFVS